MLRDSSHSRQQRAGIIERSAIWTGNQQAGSCGACRLDLGRREMRDEAKIIIVNSWEKRTSWKGCIRRQDQSIRRWLAGDKTI